MDRWMQKSQNALVLTVRLSLVSGRKRGHVTDGLCSRRGLLPRRLRGGVCCWGVSATPGP